MAVAVRLPHPKQTICKMTVTISWSYDMWIVECGQHSRQNTPPKIDGSSTHGESRYSGGILVALIFSAPTTLASLTNLIKLTKHWPLVNLMRLKKTLTNLLRKRSLSSFSISNICSIATPHKPCSLPEPRRFQALWSQNSQHLAAMKACAAWGISHLQSRWHSAASGTKWSSRKAKSILTCKVYFVTLLHSLRNNDGVRCHHGKHCKVLRANSCQENLSLWLRIWWTKVINPACEVLHVMLPGQPCIIKHFRFQNIHPLLRFVTGRVERKHVTPSMAFTPVLGTPVKAIGRDWLSRQSLPALRIQWELKAQLYKFVTETCSYLWEIKLQGSLKSRDKGQNKDAARWQVCDSFDITGKAFTVNWRIGSWFRTFLTGPAISSTFWLAFASHGTERFGNLNENLSEATALRQKNPSRKLTVWLVARTLSQNNTFLNLHPSAQKNICDGKRWNWSQIFGVIVLRRK